MKFEMPDDGKLTIVVKSPAVIEDIEYPDAVVIEYDAAMFHADRCSDAGVHPRTLELLGRVFYTGERVRSSFDVPVPPPTLWSEWPKSKATRHLFGLIDMTLKMTVPVVWRTPEAFLHPAQACELGDVLLEVHRVILGVAR